MAVLVHIQSGKSHRLLSETLVGRGTSCHLHLANPVVSRAHAQIRWTGHAWEIHDLNSRNGTHVDGCRIDRGQRVAIVKGQTVAFGNFDDSYELVDDSPPTAHVVNSRGERREARAQMIVLPDPQHPRLTVFQDCGTWLFEDSKTGERRPACNGNVLALGDDTWTLHLPTVLDRTLQNDAIRPHLDCSILRFSVSRDQENIGLTLIHHGRSVALKTRAHMELLLRLAEVRLEHGCNPDISSADEGWIEVSELLKKLGKPDDACSRNLLDQHVFQARQQLARASVVGYMDIVQRRNTTAIEGKKRITQIRIGASGVEIGQQRADQPPRQAA